MARYLIQVTQDQTGSSEIIAICHAMHGVWDSFWREKGCTVEAVDVPEVLSQGDVVRLQAYLAPPRPIYLCSADIRRNFCRMSITELQRSLESRNQTRKNEE